MLAAGDNEHLIDPSGHHGFNRPLDHRSVIDGK